MSEKEFPSKPIAYFRNSQGARFAVYNEKELVDSIDKGYQQINENDEHVPQIKEPQKEEKVC